MSESPDEAGQAQLHQQLPCSHYYLAELGSYALTQIILPKLMIGRWCSVSTLKSEIKSHIGSLPTSFTFITPPGFPPFDSHKCWTPWSVLQDGSDENI
jgi:hypothetical protein